jgi:hypothetical protein
LTEHQPRQLIANFSLGTEIYREAPFRFLRGYYAGTHQFNAQLANN